MSAGVEPWTCAMHCITTMGDCPRCDDELIAGAEAVEATRAEGDVLALAKVLSAKGLSHASESKPIGEDETCYLDVDHEGPCR